MRRLGSMWDALSSSFWFVPAVMTAGAILLFVVTYQADKLLDANLSGVPIIFSGGANAARSVLSTIAGSLIMVVATVFSLTIVALQLASANYSPRLLRNFTSDRGVQIVLGAYIATFTYSILILRIIRTPRSDAAPFVPIISVTVAVLLALVCVGLLIYFIPHIASMIQSSTIVQSAHMDAVGSLNNLTDLDRALAETEDPESHPGFRELLDGAALVLRAAQSGYVQYLDAEVPLEALAGGREKMVVEAPHGSGFFVAAGLPLVRLWPVPEGGLGTEAEESARRAFSLGKERSFRQDFAFGIRQLADIALKGVSPGVNDPTTSMQAMDRMEAILVALGGKALPPRVQEREAGGTKFLLKVGHYDFDDVVGVAFDQLRRASFTSGPVAVLERMRETVGRAMKANDLPEVREPCGRGLSTWGDWCPSRSRIPGMRLILPAKPSRSGLRCSKANRARRSVRTWKNWPTCLKTCPVANESQRPWIVSGRTEPPDKPGLRCSGEGGS